MPSLHTLPATATEAEIIEAVNRDGAVIVKDLMSQSSADEVHAQTIEYINHSPKGNEVFTGAQTTRTGALVARSAACCDLVVNKLILSAVDAFLTPFCERVQLHLTQVIRIGPKQPVQPLHRDRQAWGQHLPSTIEPQLNTLWALTEFTKTNGATQVVPGSHKWDYSRKAAPEEIAYAEMSRGSVLIYSGSVIHGGGENSSNDDRMGVNITYSLGWLRQEENQYLSCPPEVAKDLQPELQELLGYTMGSIACGYYSQLLPPGEAKELCAPENALGRPPRPEMGVGIVDQ